MELQHAAPGLSLVVVGRSCTLLLPVGLSSWLWLSLVVVQMGVALTAMPLESPLDSGSRIHVRRRLPRANASGPVPRVV